MKKVIYATLALGALILASCQKENSVNGPKVESPVFTAYIDTDAPFGQPETKTVLNGKTSLWNQDHIWILNGNSENTGWKKEYKTDATQSVSASFTEVVNTPGLGSGPVVAICPMSAGNDAWWNSKSPNVVNALELNPKQSAVAGSYDPSAHIAVAYSENNVLSFINAVSLLKFTVGSDNVSEVCVYSNTSTEVLSGSFNVAVTGGDKGKIYTGTGNNYVKVTGSFVKGQTYYIACLPTKFTNGFTVEVVSNGVKGEDKKTTKEYTLKRNTILDLGVVEYIEKVVDTRTLYLETGDWNTSNPKYDAWIWGVDERWVDFEQASSDGKYFKVTIPKGTTGLKIYRRSQEHTSYRHDDNKWNCSGGINIDDTINCIKITGWDNSASTSTEIPTF